MHRVHDLARVDLNLLVVLDALLEARSTTLVGKRLGRTQSAVSHALGRLREALGDPLFVRAGAALRPTARAEALARPVRELLERAQAVFEGKGPAFDPARLERTFVLAGSDYAEVLLLPTLLPRLRAAAPGVDLVTRMFGDDVDLAVQAGEVDLAFASRFRPLAGLVAEEARRDDLVVLMRQGHPASRGKLTLARYVKLDHALVTPRGLPGSAVDTALELRGLARRVVLRLPHFSAAAAVVTRTDVVVTLPRGFAQRAAKDLALAVRPLPLDVPGFTFFVGYGAGVVADPAHRWFRGEVLRAARAG